MVLRSTWKVYQMIFYVIFQQQKFRNAISSGISDYVPTKRIGPKVSLPWITQSIKRQIRKRDKLYIKMKKDKTSRLKSTFLNLKNEIKKNIKLSYNNYIEYILGITDQDGQAENTGSNFDNKNLFSLIKSAKQDATGISTLFDKISGTTKSDDKDKANILNQQFQSVFTPMSPLTLSQSCISALKNSNVHSSSSKYPVMPEILISTNGVLKLLSNLKPHKAAGPDNIKPLVLQTLRHQISPILSLLFQKSLDTGILPNIWTSANVVPLFKKGNKEDPANYRPISLTCILCKVLEHIVASNLTAHFNKNNILYDLQHGFRERRSCETQLLQLIDELAKNLITGRQTDLILLDFSKAFDKVSHLKLLFKLQEHGVNESTISWIKSFLIGRSQKVVLEGECSSEVPVTSGVPQGSVLGPLLFLLYINDLPTSISSQVRLFADDTAVYLALNNLQDCYTLQDDLDKLVHWEKMWDMEFNPNKCVVLNISKKKQKICFNYRLHGQTLEVVDSAKYLGVSISEDLSWNKHIDNITTTANKTLGFIRRNILTKKENIKEVAYKTLVRPQLEYASSVWSPHTKSNIDKIEKVQRRAVRWVKQDYSYYSSVTSMQSQLGWQTLQDRRDLSRLIMFYKIMYGLVAISLPPYLERPMRVSRHMHPLSLRQVHTSSNYFKFSFFPYTVVLWNSLPASVVLQADLEGFKRCLSPSLLTSRP